MENAAYHAYYSGRSFVSLSDLTLTREGPKSESDASFHEQVERFKLHLVEEALARCDGSQVRAARMLRLDRGTLRRIVGRTAVS